MTRPSAEKVTPPVVVNGRIGRAGDVDVFRFDGRAGETVVAAVDARRLGSPLDSAVRVLDSAGHVLGSNDDAMPGDADSSLTVRLPAGGAYLVEVSDSHGRGGPAYAYRLRISPPMPDFRLAVSPAGLAVPADACLPVTVHVLRTDGFTGPVAVALKAAPHGFSLSGATVPAGVDSIRMTLQAPGQSTARPVELKLEGAATIAGQAVTHAATAVDTAGAALFWGQPEPCADAGGGGAAVQAGAARRAGAGRAGAGARRRLGAGRGHDAAAAGVRAGRPGADGSAAGGDGGATRRSRRTGSAFRLRADGRDAKPGLTDNLILSAYAEGDRGDRGDRGRQRREIGVLPAIAFVVVNP